VLRRQLPPRQHVQYGFGNTAQSGIANVAALNGSFNSILSIGSGNP
jgi:hypothetical protein